jgi:hypothetical protein
VQDLNRLVGNLRRKQLGARIDPGQPQRQLGQNASQRLSDMAGAVQPQRRQASSSTLQQLI